MKTNQPITTAQKLLAVSGTLALITFFVLGFAFHAWEIAWVVFLVPGLLRRWVSFDEPKESPRSGYGIDDDGTPKPYPYT